MYLFQYHLLSRFQISHIMSNISYECNATEFDCIPLLNNDKNIFVINENSLIINLMNDQNILVQTEIDKADAYRLARLILLVYEKM
jgi:hypothetical protein